MRVRPEAEVCVCPVLTLHTDRWGLGSQGEAGMAGRCEKA